MDIRGWVYVISNEAMPDLIKVGYSTKDPHLRALELNNTGSPRPYVVEYDALVHAPREIEQQIHKELRGKRDGKEWFRCSVREAVAAIHSITATKRIAESYRDRSALDIAPAPNVLSRELPSMARSNRNSAGRWSWSERTKQLVEKAGHRSFGPEQYSYECEGQLKGFAIRDKETLWVAIEDVDIIQ